MQAAEFTSYDRSRTRPDPDRPASSPRGLAQLSAQTRVTAYQAQETIYSEADAADFIYEVVEGLVRTVRLTHDGRRVVQSFVGPSQIFGLERNGSRACSAEAVCPTQVARCERAQIERLAQVDLSAAEALWRWLMSAQEQAAGRLSLVVRGSPAEKVAHFLLEMAHLLGACGRLQLPMSRYDIADYLGLSSETVSRTFTLLRDRGLISVEGRAIVLLRPAALKRLDPLPHRVAAENPSFQPVP